MSENNVAIVGGTLWGNRGAEAMLVTTIGQIRRRIPDARFMVFSYYPDRDARLCNDPTIEFYNCRPLNLGLRIFPLSMLACFFAVFGIRLPSFMLGRETNALRDADVLCDVGGITFCDGRELFLLYNVLSIVPAMLMGVPVVKMSQALGPFQNPINRFLARRILPQCHHSFARGSVTEAHLRELGVNNACWSAASDVAFSFAPEFSLSRENSERLSKLESRYNARSGETFQTLAVIPSSLVMQKNSSYIDCLVEFIRDIIIAKNHVMLLPNATRDGSGKTRNNDLVAIKQIVDTLSVQHPEVLRHVTAVDFDANTEGLRRLMRHADVLVTSRFHGMVAALATAIPTVVIGWSHKYAEVLARFNCEELSIDHQTSQADLTPRVLRVLANQATHRQRLLEELPGVKADSERQFDFVCDLLENGTSGGDHRKNDSRFDRQAFEGISGQPVNASR